MFGDLHWISVLEQLSVKTNLLIYNNVTGQKKQTEMGKEKISHLRFEEHVWLGAGGCEPSSVCCWTVSNHAEIYSYEPTPPLIHWTKQQHQRWRHNKLHWWHSLGEEDKITFPANNLAMLIYLPNLIFFPRSLNSLSQKQVVLMFQLAKKIHLPSQKSAHWLVLWPDTS